MTTGIMQGVGNVLSGGMKLMADLWNGQVPPTYRTNNAKRIQGEYAIAMAMLMGRQVDVLRGDIQASCPDDYDELIKQPMTFNLTKRISEKRATLYREPPSFSGDVGEWEKLLVWGFWAALNQADLISEVCNVCPVLFEWDSKRNAIVPFVLPPDNTTLVFHPMDQTRLLSATVFTTSYDAQGKQCKCRTVYTETEKRVYMGDSCKDVSAEMAEREGYDYEGPEHGVGRVPVILIRPHMALHGEPLGQYNESLVQANRTLNQKATELQLLLKNQAHSNLVVTGDLKQKDGRVSTAVSRYLQFNTQPKEAGSSSAAWISPSPNADALLKTIMDTVRMVAFFHHLPSSFSLDGEQAQSGVALRIKNLDLEEYRRSKIEAHSLMWPDLADLLERVRVTGQGGEHHSQENVRVQIAAQTTFQSPEEIRAELEWEILHLLTAVAEAYLAVHPEFEADKDDAQRLALAAAAVAKNAIDFRALNGRGTTAVPTIPAGV